VGRRGTQPGQPAELPLGVRRAGQPPIERRARVATKVGDATRLSIALAGASAGPTGGADALFAGHEARRPLLILVAAQGCPALSGASPSPAKTLAPDGGVPQHGSQRLLGRARTSTASGRARLRLWVALCSQGERLVGRPAIAAGARARRPPRSQMPPPSHRLFHHSRPNAPPREAGWDQRPASANFATYRPSHAPAPPLSPPLENLPRGPRAREVRADRWIADRREAAYRREPLRMRGGSGGGGSGGGRGGGGFKTGRDWQELLDEGTGGAQQVGMARFQPTRRPRPVARVTLSVADVGPGQGGPFAASVRHVQAPMRGSPMLASHHYE
jgi:hypothetical protein